MWLEADDERTVILVPVREQQTISITFSYKLDAFVEEQ